MWGSSAGRSPAVAEARVSTLENVYKIYDDFSTFVAGDFSGTECRIVRAVAGGRVLKIRLVATGTTGGVPTVAANVFTDLAANGEVINAAGNGYTLPEDHGISPWIFGAGAELTVAGDAAQNAIDFVHNAWGGGTVYINRKWLVEDEVRLKAGVTLKGNSSATGQLIASAGVGVMPTKARNVTSCPVVAVDGVSGVSLQRIGIIGNVGLASSTETESGGLYIDGAEDVEVTKCLIKNGREYCAAIGSDNKVTGLSFTKNRVRVDANTNRASHYTNLIVPTYVEDADISANTLFVDASIVAPMVIAGGINCENWGAGTSEWDTVSVSGNHIINRSAKAFNGLQVYGGEVISMEWIGNQLTNCGVRARTTIRSLTVSTNQVLSAEKTIDAAYKFDECNGAGSAVLAVLSVQGNITRTCEKDGMIFANNTPTTGGLLLLVNSNVVNDFGTDGAATRYGMTFVSVDIETLSVQGNIINTDTTRAHCVGMRFYSTDNGIVKNNKINAYTCMSFENSCNEFDVAENKLIGAVQISNYSLTNSKLSQSFEFVWSSSASVAAETVFSVPSKASGELLVTTSDDANNANKLYGAKILFTRGGTASVSITEVAEVIGAAMAWTASGANIQAARGGTAYTDRVFVKAEMFFG